MSEEEPLRVLLLAGRFEVRGSSKQTLNLANGLPERGVEPAVLCLDARRLSAADRARLPLAERAPLAWPVAGRLLRRWLLSDWIADPPDLIHIQGQSTHPLGVWLARQARCPYVLTVHAEPTPRETFRLDRRWGRRVVATSEAVRSAVLEHTRTRADDVILIRNGVAVPGEELGARTPVLDRGHRPVVGTAGPLVAGKGVGEFLRAIPRVLSAG